MLSSMQSKFVLCDNLFHQRNLSVQKTNCSDVAQKPKTPPKCPYRYRTTKNMARECAVWVHDMVFYLVLSVPPKNWRSLTGPSRTRAGHSHCFDVQNRSQTAINGNDTGLPRERGEVRHARTCFHSERKKNCKRQTADFLNGTFFEERHK